MYDMKRDPKVHLGALIGLEHLAQNLEDRLRNVGTDFGNQDASLGEGCEKCFRKALLMSIELRKLINEGASWGLCGQMAKDMAEEI